MRPLRPLGLLLTLALLGAFFASSRLTAIAAPVSQADTPPPVEEFLTPFLTPTPGQDGRIVYIAKPGDTLWRIAAVSGLGNVDELKALNNLTSDIVVVGQELLLGTVAAPATPIPTATLPVTPAGGGQPLSTEIAENAPVSGTGDICYLLYEDLNGNGLRESSESPIPAGQFLLANANGQPVDSYTTTADASQEPHCTRELAVGGYNITVQPPAGYNSTTITNSPLSLEAGATMAIEFGAQKSARATAVSADTPIADDTRLRTALYAAAGVVFLLLAAGLAGFLFLSRRSA